MNTKEEQPLNVEMGKREADAMFRRRDRMERIQREREARERDETPAGELSRWINENYPAGFPKEWFR